MQDREVSLANRLLPWGMAVLLCGLLLLCYWPALRGGLVWDDQAHITEPDLRSWAGLGRIWFELGATQQYYPILHSAFWVEHRLWGDATLGYHLTNLVLQAVACCLLALVLRRLWSWAPVGPGGSSRRTVPAGAEWLAALIFAVHPVGVESVAWISEQKNTLSLVFYLLAAFFYLDFESTRKQRSYWLATGLFLLALGTKSVTATLPAALLVMLWWRNGRLTWRRDVGPLIPWFVVALAAGLFTAWVERKFIGAEGAAFDLRFDQRVLLAGRVVWFYLGKLFWPTDLMFIYPRWDVPAVSAGWYGYLGGALALTIGLWLFRRRFRGPLAGWLFFVGTLFPALGFFNVYPFLFSYVADHFQYLASIGIIAPVAYGLARFLAGASAPMRTGGWVLGALLVAGLGYLSNQQSRMYANGETLYRVTLARNPSCWLAYNNLAFLLAKDGSRVPEAIELYERALSVRPDYAEAHMNLAGLLVTLPGTIPRAMEHYQQALLAKPGYAEAHYNLANLLVSFPGRLPEALTHYELALQLKPDFVQARLNLANELAKISGRESDALVNYEQVLQMKPDFADAHYNYAVELARLPGRLPDAIEHYQEALRFMPDLAEAHANLASIFVTLPGRLPEALAHFQEALRILPESAEVHYNLANALADLPGREPEAISHYERALIIRPDFAEAHVNLANLLARIPARQTEALAYYEQALRINPGLASAHYGLAFQLSDLPGREADAQLNYEEALRLKSDYPAAHNNLAILFARQGRLDEARKHWEQALAQEPNFDEARRNLDLLDQLQKR